VARRATSRSLSVQDNFGTYTFGALLQKFTTQHHIHHQMVGYSRVSRVRVRRVRVSVRIRVRVRLSFSGANLNRKTLGGELLPERPLSVHVFSDLNILGRN